MRALDRLSIAAKLLLAPATILALLLLLAGSAYYGLTQQQGALDNIFQVRFNNFRLASESAAKSQQAYAGTFQLLSSAAASFPANRLEAMSKDLQGTLAAIDRQVGEIGHNGTATPEEAELIGKLGKQLAAYRKSTVGVIEVSLTDYSMGATMMTIASKDFAELSRQMNELLAVEQKLSNEAYDEARATSGAVTKTLVGILALSIATALAVSLLVRARIVATVDAIRTAALDLKSGDLTRRVTVHGSDEIAQTAHAFNELIDGFQRAVHKVLGAASGVGDATRRLTDNSQSVASGSTRQADAASAMAATMEQMAVSISSIAENAQQVKDTSRQSLANTRAGSTALERLLDEIKCVREAFVAITESIGDFVQSTHSITSMTQQVKELADQTNLLALNAAIEAARAGEQGRGFAVVADEVRKLAERSSAAANDIDGVTRALEQQAVVVEQSLDDGTASLGSSEQHLRELERVISSARDTVTAANQGVDEIAGAVREQSSASNDIAHNVDEIVRMVEENNAAIGQAATTTEQLRLHAESLQAAVAVFRA